MIQIHENKPGRSNWPRVVAGLGLAIAVALLPGGPALAQMDVCGCSGNPNSLGAFNTLDPATYPPGTVSTSQKITLQVPPDGVMVFDSMHIQVRPSVDGNILVVNFKPNAANTPVTLLVKGNLTISSVGATTFFANPSSAWYPILSVAGEPGVSATVDILGAGGLGGPGGFRGGDGAYRLVNAASDGGAGLGPGGGVGAVASPFVSAGSGTFLGVTELLPILGGSGGGGGESSGSNSGCSGGGGGGGGGAILIAVNGTATIGGTISADGGDRGSPSSGGTCASVGGSGAGGAVRLLAGKIANPNPIVSGLPGMILARSGSPRPITSNGSIRLESQENEFLVSRTDPIATRAGTPGPLTNPLTPTVAITNVAGQPVPQPPQGVFGKVDVTIPAPGQIGIDLATSGVPSGTGVQVTAKPRVGPAATSTTIVLTSCDGSGACIATAPLTLAAGNYTIEARATFATP